MAVSSNAVSGKFTQTILRLVEPIVFAYRVPTLIILFAITGLLMFQASKLEPNAGWLKMVPKEHPYMQTFLEYYKDFGGANTILVSMNVTGEGDIYTPERIEKLQKLTDEVFFVPGVDRSRVTSILTPQIIYVEIIEGGMAGAAVRPKNWGDETPSQEVVTKIKSNVAKASVIGRLVSEDHRAALVVAELLDFNPDTGEPLDYVEVGQKLEAIRAQFEDADTSIHIIGFAKVVDDMTAAATEVALFFAISLVLTSILLWLYVGNVVLAFLPMFVSVIACVWEMGLLASVGFGLDPFAILVPFLILSVSVSHGVQYVNKWAHDVSEGASSYDASVETFRALAIPGTIALITDIAGFATIYLINIDVIREMSVNAAFGMAAIIITNKIMMPGLLCYVKLKDPQKFIAAQARREQLMEPLFKSMSKVVRTGPSLVVIGIAVCLAIYAATLFPQLRIGETQDGVPELRPDSRFNVDARAVAEDFAMGVDQFKIIAETVDDACIDFGIMAEIDNFGWYMKNQNRVRDVLSLLDLAKVAYSGLNEGRLNAETLPRNKFSLAQSTALVPTTTGLLNDECSALALFVFTADHKAETIIDLVNAVKHYEANEKREPRVTFRLASGNVGVMAATNEVVKDKELEVVGYVYVVILIFLWLSFRTFSGVICVVLPLSLVTFMGYGVMVLMDIGQKVATLPVLALATGIGVDYGIYIYSTIAEGLRTGKTLEEAYYDTLKRTGKAVLFTGVALGVSVITWLWSKLQFQADMGLILVFAFTANMFGAIFLLPALARFLSWEERRHAVKQEDSA